MCGIAAIFNYRTGAPIDRAELTTIRDAMTPRGPDGFGEWFSADGRVGLGHRRLAIIDPTPAGAQPMKNRDGSLVITFNGEIYNYLELRSELERKGCHFQSGSDTEVLLHLYAVEGEAMVTKLRGMYAFAIWDERKQGLFLARDPFGIKPLYYSDDGKCLRIASQVKALLAGGHIDTAPEPAGHVGFFLWGHVPSPYTLYRGVRGLPAGSILWIDQAGTKRERTFCSIPQILATAEHAPRSTLHAPPSERLRSALQDTVRAHLIADVPVGVFLSSGLDSTSLAALAAEQGTTLRTVTLGFEEFRGSPNDEVPLAEQVACQLGAQHQTIWVTSACFQKERERLFASMDQPSTDGVNTFFVSLAARRAGLKVALSGLGGDELLGGYPSFHQIPQLVRWLGLSRHCPTLDRGFRLITAPLLKRMTSPKYAGLLEYGGTYSGAYLLRRSLFMPWELPDLLDAELVRQGWQELQPMLRLEETVDGLKRPRSRVTSLETCWYMRNQLLRDSDWAGMAHSLEIRVPLVDIKLLQGLAPLLVSKTPPTKRDMAESAFRTPNPAFRTLLARPKTGFSIPVRDWLLPGSQPSTHSAPGDRGLRGWAKEVYSRFPGSCPRTQPVSRSTLHAPRSTSLPSSALNSPSSLRVLVLLSDAFGGHGGISKFNRDLLSALCSDPAVCEVVALPRLMPSQPGILPPKLTWVTAGVGGKLRFIRAAIKLARSRPFDLVICGHINLLPIAFLARHLSRNRFPRTPQSEVRTPHSADHQLSTKDYQLPLTLIIHGIDAWQPTRSPLVNRLAPKADAFVAVSELTRNRFLKWSRMPHERAFILPNCVELSKFQPGPKPDYLLKRYGLEGRTVLLTLGRLVSSERAKGFDEVIEVLPSLANEIPNLSYLIVGDGDDSQRLKDKARSLGLAVYDCSKNCALPAPQSPLPRVVFAGYVSEREKADHYRLADVYVMPSHGEGFGIVYLEALACGLPVIGSKLDGSREALLGGKLGILVDPANLEELKAAVHQVLERKSRPVPEGLEYYSYTKFEERCHHLVRQLLG
jgi:asparagine synthase (glutamine-hydrolysing)